MAAVLGHGTVLEHSVHMHPFFRGANNKNDVAQSALCAGQGSDGDYADAGAEGHPGANAALSLPRDAHNLPPQSNPITPETRVGGPWSVTEEDDLEHENTRVKRRRVSVEPAQPPSQTVVGTIRNQSTWHEQLEDAAKTLAEPQEEGLEAERPMCHYAQTTREPVPQGHSGLMAEPFLPFPTSSITVEIDLPQPTFYPPPSTDGAMDDPPLPRTKASATSKKKMLQSDHGKLTFSPKKSPRHSPRSAKVSQISDSDGIKKTARSARKVETKNGRLVSSMRVALPYSAPDSAARIDEIMSGKGSNGNTHDAAARPAVPSSKLTAAKTTHPFFLGKAAVEAQNKQADLRSEPPSVVVTTDDDAHPKQSPKAPKPWKDIVFGSGKPVRQVVISLPPIWPPALLQHIHPYNGTISLRPLQTIALGGLSKLKQHALRLGAGEDILRNFSSNLKPVVGPLVVQKPTRIVTSGNDFYAIVDSVFEASGTVESRPNLVPSLKPRIESTSNSFDKGMAAGPQMWVQEYAPTCWQEVLQSQSKVLYDWLRDLQVHQVQSGKAQKSKPPTPKKRRKRRSDDMDDFIADSDDDDTGFSANGKNTILLVGPPGSGKTASVYAVAQQLGFEVFEIHPGMRRSGRDIEDKVGDMTRNHLVQPSSSLSRESSASIDDRVVLTHGPLPVNQKTMAGFMKPKRGKQPKVEDVKESRISAATSQKQSVILFEEVDILFEEDKGFWTQVQHLKRTSKRPVILTCNSADYIPFDELNLFTVLRYGRPGPDVAVHHLGRVAAAEGHLLSREALRNLYLSKGQDLRAALTELNLWCQMTVGSQQGGLDWMLPYRDKRKFDSDGSVTRIVSQDTFTGGLDLLPEQFEDVEDLIRFAQDSLGIPPLEWVKDTGPPTIDATVSLLQSLNDMAALSDAKSAIDVFDEFAAVSLADIMRKLPASTSTTGPVQRDEVVQLYLSTLNATQPTRPAIASAFDPLLEESRIGLPTAPGRKAASLDNPSSLAVITEVAPYVRLIVSHDKLLEQLRSEMHGSSQNSNGANKRQRRTRAARAAMEGGSKVTTRRDKWFAENLDWDAVLQTGSNWPMARGDDAVVGHETLSVGSEEQTDAATPSSSLATETEVEV